MGNACSKGFQYKRLITSVYPARNETQLNKENLKRLVMYSITNSEKLSILGKRIEKTIRNDYARRNYGFVEIGAKIFNELVERCHSELVLFVANVTSISHLLLSSDNVRLKIAATDLLYTTVGHLGEALNNNLDSFIQPLATLCLWQKSANANENIRIRIAALRLLAKMINDIESHLLEHLDVIVPVVLQNIHENTSTATVTNTAENRMSVRSPADMTAATNNDDAFIVTGSLNDSAIASSVTTAHLRVMASECLSCITTHTSVPTLVSFLKPLLGYLDASGAWNSVNFLRDITFRFITSGPWYQNGYVVVTQIISHFNTQECSIKVRMIEMISYIVEIQRVAVDPRVSQVVSSLIKILLSTLDAPDQNNLQDAIFAVIGKIARRGQNTPQNIDLMAAVFSYIQRLESGDSARRRLLLRCIQHISCCPVETSISDHFPEHLFRPVINELTTDDSSSRLLALQILQQLIQLQATGPVLAGSMLVSTPSTSTQISAQSNQGEVSGKPKGKGTVKHPTFSDKQRSEIHAALFRATTIANNQPSNYAEIYRTIKFLLQQFRIKAVEEVVPLMFRLQEICSDTTSPKLDAARCNAVHTLVAAFFMQLAKFLNNAELEAYVKQIAEQRIKAGQVQLSKFKIADDFSDFDAASDSVTFNDADAASVKPVSTENLINSESVIAIVSKIESLVQGNKQIREVLSTSYMAELRPQGKAVEKEDPDNVEWEQNMSILDDQSDTSFTVADGVEDDAAEDIDALYSARPNASSALNFAVIGTAATVKKQLAERELDTILDLIPKQQQQPAAVTAQAAKPATATVPIQHTESPHSSARSSLDRDTTNLLLVASASAATTTEEPNTEPTSVPHLTGESTLTIGLPSMSMFDYNPSFY